MIPYRGMNKIALAFLIGIIGGYLVAGMADSRVAPSEPQDTDASYEYDAPAVRMNEEAL